VDNIIFCVFSDADLHVYRAALPEFFDVYYDADLDVFVPEDLPARAPRDEAPATAATSRMSVIVDSLSYSRPSYESAGGNT
jgi:hypothetical protein